MKQRLHLYHTGNGLQRSLRLSTARPPVSVTILLLSVALFLIPPPAAYMIPFWCGCASFGVFGTARDELFVNSAIASQNTSVSGGRTYCNSVRYCVIYWMNKKLRTVPRTTLARQWRVPDTTPTFHQVLALDA